MFHITQGKGFHIRFMNGVTLSTQFGGGNYSENYDYPISPYPDNSDTAKLRNIMDMPGSATVEIAIWNKNNGWITDEMHEKVFSGGDIGGVMGYIDIEDWYKVLKWCKNLKNKKLLNKSKNPNFAKIERK